MRLVVTGSSGHLGEALVRSLEEDGHEVVGLDILASPTTAVVGSVSDRFVVRRALEGAAAVLHTATLHKPHLSTHSRSEFVETNVAGTLTVLEAAAEAEVGCVVYTSTTSAFGRALTPAPGGPAAWITEDVVPRPKNVYGATKVAAEDLCELVHGETGLPCVVLRVARFFPEPDDVEDARESYSDLNLKTNELLYRRVDLADVVEVHRLALARASSVGFGRYVVSATTPFRPEHAGELSRDTPSVVASLYPGYEELYARLGWRMHPRLDRVYVNARARADLGWQPHYDFASALERLAAGEDPRSPLALRVGAKGYHATTRGVYTVR